MSTKKKAQEKIVALADQAVIATEARRRIGIIKTIALTLFTVILFWSFAALCFYVDEPGTALIGVISVFTGVGMPLFFLTL